MTNVDTLNPPMLFPDDWARTRLSDPFSSHVAADKSQRTIKELKRAVLELMDIHGTLNGKEINELYSLGQLSRPDWPLVDRESPRKRAEELAKAGLLLVTNPDCPRGTPRVYRAVSA